MKRLFLSLVLWLSVLSSAANFQGLGAGSVANDISVDGSVVVGYRQNHDYWGGGYTSFIYWTAAGGTVELSISSIENVIPTDIFDDGMKIDSYVTHRGSDNWSNPFYKEAFLYELGVGRTELIRFLKISLAHLF